MRPWGGRGRWCPCHDRRCTGALHLSRTAEKHQADQEIVGHIEGYVHPAEMRLIAADAETEWRQMFGDDGK